MIAATAVVLLVADAGAVTGGVEHVPHPRAPAARTSTVRPPPAPSRTGATTTGTAVLPPTPTPTSGGPAPSQTDVVFTSPSTGFVLIRPDGDTEQNGEVQRTVDGGRTWQTVWQAPGVTLSSMTWIDGRLLVSGATEPPADSEGSPAPFLLTSDDGGDAWARRAVTVAGTNGSDEHLFALRLHFVDRMNGFAVPDVLGDSPQSVALRTTDGGLHWAPLQLPEGAEASGGIAFTNREDGYLTVGHGGQFGPGSSCDGQILTTTDGGGTWTPNASSCVPFPLVSLSFPDPSHGFAGGGFVAKSEEAPRQAVVGTSDGGAHWSVLYRATPSTQGSVSEPFGELTFVSPAQGYALAGECTDGENGPCPGGLWTTDDGGRTWQARRVEGFRLSAPAPADVWLAADQEVLAHSVDFGRTFIGVGQPAMFGVTSLLASGPTIYVRTDSGDFLSPDAGRTWRSLTLAGLPPELETAAPTAVDANGTMIFVSGTGVWVSHNFGATGNYVATGLPAGAYDGPPSVGLSGNRLVAVEGDRTNAEVASSTDGGVHWSVRAASGLPHDEAGGKLGLAISTSGLALGGELGGVFVSADGGGAWKSLGIGPEIPTKDDGPLVGPECSVTGHLDLVGYYCDETATTIALARSVQGPFSQLTLEPPPETFDGSSAMAIGGPTNLVVAGGPDLWQSADQGRTWRAILAPWDRLGAAT